MEFASLVLICGFLVAHANEASTASTDCYLR